MKIIVADKISELGVKMFEDAGFKVDVKTGLPEDELVKIIGDYDAMIVRSETKVTATIIEAGKKLKIVGRAGVGVDNVDLPAATKHGIIVVNSPEGNTVAAAEHTWAMLLAMARFIPQAYAKLKNGVWDRKYKGVELLDKTLGVVGLGKIGRRVVSYALGMGMKVIAYDPFITEEYSKTLGVTLKSFEDVIKNADFITLHIPKTKETANIISAESIAKMKKGVRIVNVARGGIIDEKALYDALKSGQVAAAALDVFEKEPTPADNPLLTLDNVVATPHLGASTVEAQVNVAIDVVEQIIDVLRGGAARSAVNIPSMKPELIAPVKPFMAIAEKLGSLAAQVVKQPISKVIVEYYGEVAENDTSPLTTTVIKGLLTPIMDVSVNFVNAHLIAKERGIEVVESKRMESKEFSSLISVKIKVDGEDREFGGTVLGKYGDRLVSIDGYRIDAVPSGHLLILSNIDKPGMIGKVGTFLGENKINIASMDVGRIKLNEEAVMILNIDSPVPDEILEKMTQIDGISCATAVKL